MPERLLLVTDSPEPSGVGVHMVTLARALAGDGMRPETMWPDHAAGRTLAAQVEAGGGTAHLVPEAALAEAVAAWCRQGPSLVHVHAGIGWEGQGLTAAAHAAGAVVLRTEHLPWLLTDPAQIKAYHAALGSVHGVIAVSAAAGAGWQDAINGRAALHVVPNGLSPVVAPDAPRSEDTILCVGRLTPQKGQRLLLGALARLRREGLVLRAQLVGDGPCRAMLARGIRRLGLQDHATLLGTRLDVPELMASAALLALPSRFEGLPLVVLEAMSAGLPVIASRVGGTLEALGEDHPWLHAPGNSRALAAMIADALRDPARRAQVAAAQKTRFQNRFTAARMAEATRAAYRAARALKDRTTMDRVRLGFIGAGGIAHRHFGVLETMPDVDVVAICDTDLGRAEEAARRMGATAHPNHEAMLAAHDLDAVFICVPPFAHGAPERACLARGLPFFVEKPITLDVELAREIAAEVAEAGLITGVGYHWRYLDTMDEARAHLATNPAHLMQGFWIDQTPPPEWWWRADRSGGQVVEQATHIIDAARFLAGDVTEVFGLAAHRERGDFPGLTVPTATAATLRFASGAVANLASTCLLRWNHRVGLHVFSDAMALEITDHDLMVDVGRGRPVRRAEGDPVWRQDRDFLEAVMGRENRIRCDYAEALLTHEVALAVSRSAETGALQRMEGLRADPQPIFRGAAAPGAGHAA